jgi:ABC-type multidrug transport system fused ATPase/permease subunit
MRDSAAVTDANPDIKTLRRFLPYLWPADSRGLRRRVVVSLLLVLAGKSVGYVMPYSLKGAIDRMSHGSNAAVGLAVALVAAYAVARFSGVLFDNVRNAIFERVGQTAARHLSQDVFVHIHKLSLRYHLERRTGALTRVVERGTKSIDTMLYFILFNIFRSSG